MNMPVSIDVDLISFITGLPSYGEKPVQYMDNKKRRRHFHRK